MIEFSNLIQVFPVDGLKNNPDKMYEFVADFFSYIPQSTDSEAGIFWNCDKTLVIDLPTEDVRRFFSIERKALVKIKTSDRRYYNIGTPDIPARILISSNLNSCSLSIKCKMLTDPLL